MLRSLKACFNYGLNVHELRGTNPVNHIKLYPVDKKLKYIPTDEEVEAVKSKLNSKQVELFKFVEETGCRINEAVNLMHEDITDGLVTLYTRKSKNSDLTPRRIPRPTCLKRDGKGKCFEEWDSYPRFLEGFKLK